MLSDLKRLMADSPVGVDVLGLVTAAGGGLTSRDLAELMLAGGHEVTDWDIEQLLATVAGRSFMSRDARWRPGTQRVYVLGHEEIQQEAARAYGPTRLAAYRTRLHEWARSYRDRGWPSDTPEYLLRGYFRLLLSTGDLQRAVDCATDLARHDRMLDLSGGDTAALAEITDIQNAILAEPEPNLRALARLAYHRSLIAKRNRNIPVELAALWVRLGRPDRAEQLARAIPDSEHQIRALTAMAAELAKVGELGRGRELAEAAERVAGGVVDPVFRARVIATLATAAARAGDYNHARMLVAAVLTTCEWGELPLDEVSNIAVEVLIVLADCALSSLVDMAPINYNNSEVG